MTFSCNFHCILQTVQEKQTDKTMGEGMHKRMESLRSVKKPPQIALDREKKDSEIKGSEGGGVKIAAFLV